MNDEPPAHDQAGRYPVRAPGCHHGSVTTTAQRSRDTAGDFGGYAVLEEGGLGALVQIDEDFKDVEFPFL